jgi:hypothetical protein
MPTRGLVLTAMVLAIVAALTVGAFALPAVIGALIVGGAAAARGVPPPQALGRGALAATVLLLAGIVLAVLTVPSTRVEWGGSAVPNTANLTVVGDETPVVGPPGR